MPAPRAEQSAGVEDVGAVAARAGPGFTVMCDPSVIHITHGSGLKLTAALHYGTFRMML